MTDRDPRDEWPPERIAEAQRKAVEDRDGEELADFFEQAFEPREGT